MATKDVVSMKKLNKPGINVEFNDSSIKLGPLIDYTDFNKNRQLIMNMFHETNISTNITKIEFNCALAPFDFIDLLRPVQDQLLELKMGGLTEGSALLDDDRENSKEIASWPPIALSKLKSFTFNPIVHPFLGYRLRRFICRILAGTDTLEYLDMTRGDSLNDYRIQDQDDEVYPELRKIVARQRGLKVFKVDDAEFFRGKIEDPKFQLKTLEGCFKLTENEAKMPEGEEFEYEEELIDNFKDFLSTQIDVELDDCETAKTIVLPPTIRSCRDPVFNLKVVHDQKWVKQPSIVKCTMCFFVSTTSKEKSVSFFKRINETYPNLQELYLENLWNVFNDPARYDKDFLEPLNNLQGLTKLQINSFYSFQQLAHLKISSLRSIHVTMKDTKVDNDLYTLCRFVANHEELEEIHIDCQNGCVDTSLLKEWIKCIRKISKKIKSVHVGATFTSP